MGNRRISVGLLFGGRSPEHEVSIVTARHILNNLDLERFKPFPIGIAKNGTWVVNNPFERLSNGELPCSNKYSIIPLESSVNSIILPDVFFIAMHGFSGEDGKIQGCLETIGIPYTGGHVLSMAAGMDKWITKLIWQANRLPVVPFIGLTEFEWHTSKKNVLNKIIKKFSLPLFIKPVNLGSSIGIQRVATYDKLIESLNVAFRFDQRVLVEPALLVREVEFAILGDSKFFIISMPGEIIKTSDFYNYEDKYTIDRCSVSIPALLNDTTTLVMKKYAELAFRIIDGYGMARVDFFLEKDTGRIFLNEINLIPGFTDNSMYPKLMIASGISYTNILTYLIDLAFQRYDRFL